MIQLRRDQLKDRMQTILKEYEANEISVTALCEKYGISRRTLYRYLEKDRSTNTILPIDK